MKTLLFLILAGYAVRCDNSNYYVVQMPDNDFLRSKDFKVYWNLPTMQCTSKKIPFGDLYEKYGILQNAGDTFRGDQISILYDPGDFPALLRNNSSGEIKYRNGGVPQEGDLIKHLVTFQKVLEQSVPDKNFNGVGIIDFETWRPVLRQNFGSLTPYKDVSYEIEKQRQWWRKKQWIQEEAKRRFEGAAREFMQATVSLAKHMRPRAVWGYYGYPYCFNMANNIRQERCANNVPQENDGIGWLWQESTALYPSVYSSNDLTAHQLAGLIRGRVREAARVAGRGVPILPYFWYRYRDNGYFSESDLDVAFSTFYKSNASGFIIWGSSNDVNTIDKCMKLKQYITDTLGPAVAKYTKRNIRLGDDSDETFTGVNIPNNATKYDPEYTWISPVNYTQKIEEMVDKELKEEKEAAVTPKNINESILVDLILHEIVNYCAEGYDDKSKVRQTDKKKGDSGVDESRLVLVTEDTFKKNSTAMAVTVPTTTVKYIYDYDLNTGNVTTGDNNETNEYVDITTTSKSIGEIIITMKSTDDIRKTVSEGDKINIVHVESEKSGQFNINEEQNSSTEESKGESTTIAITIIETKENNNNRIIIEEVNAIEISTEETNSNENSSIENSISILSTTETSINDISTTESTSSISLEMTSTIKNGLSIDDNSTESNSLEVDFIDVSTEHSSTINPITGANGTTIGDSNIIEPSGVEYGTTDELSAVDSDITYNINITYDLNTGNVTTGDNYETNEYVDISTTDKSIGEIITTMKSTDDIRKTVSEGDKINIVHVESEKSGQFNINEEQNSSTEESKGESTTIAITIIETKENNNNRIIIEEVNAIEISTEETNSNENSSIENSISILSTTETSINDNSTTESTSNISLEMTSTIKNGLSIDDNSTESNSLEVDFIDVSTEHSSTINPITGANDTTIGDSNIIEPSGVEYGTTDELSAVDSDITYNINITYDLNTGNVTTGDNYETNEYVDISTTDKSIGEIITTMKSTDDIRKTVSEGDKINIVHVESEKSGQFNINEEQNSSTEESKGESTTIAITIIETKENNNNRIIIEEVNAIEISTEETNSNKNSSIENSISILRTTETSINDISTTESTTNVSLEMISTIENGLNTDDNSTESNSLEVDFIDVSTEHSSTINPSTSANGTTIGDSTIIEPSGVEYGTTDELSAVDSDTTYNINITYDLNTGNVTTGDNYETNEYVDITTTSKSIGEIITTMKSTDDIRKTVSEGDKINIVHVESEKSGQFNINEEQNSSTEENKGESTTITITIIETKENNNKRIIIEEVNATEISTEETNSNENSSIENSISILRTTKTSINDISTTESTTNISLEMTSTIENGLSIDDNSTESNSLEVDFIDVSTEHSSTINPNTGANGTTIGDSNIIEPSGVEYGTTDELSAVDSDITTELNVINNSSVNNDSSTTLAPVVVSVV